MENNFYLDIFNKLLLFNDEKIFIIFDKKGNIWFNLKDLLKIIGYKDFDKSKKDLNINKDYLLKLNDIEKNNFNKKDYFNIQLTSVMINHEGLFYILSKSKKPIAKLFMNKYITEIMPSISKTGKYISSNNEQKKIDKINEKLNNIKNENNYLNNNYDFKTYDNGYIYIYELDCIKNGKNIKCYKFGITKDMKSRYKNYLTGNPKIKLLCYAILDIDIKQLENCVKNITSKHAIKNNVETIKINSLLELKNIILDCYDIIKNHTCNCVICNKKYKFNNIDKHLCNNNIEFISFKKNKIIKKNSKKNNKNIK